MYKLKSKAMYFLMFALILLFACKSKTTEDIGKKIDTVANKIGKEIDTLATKMTTKSDSTFDKVKVTEVDTTGRAPDKVRSRINSVFSDYIDIKNALVKSDSGKAINKANQLKSDLAAINDTTLNTKMRSGWKSSTTKINKAADDIAAGQTLNDQRKAFSTLTDVMMSLIKTYGLNSKTIYVLQCTESKSKYKEIWLTADKDSDNPYASGKASNAKENVSAKCGEVKEAWKFK